MATDRYPNRNVNMPIPEGRLAAARARTGAGRAPHYMPMTLPPGGGKGSKRETRPGEWIDDRVIDLNAPIEPSKETPPEPPEPSQRVTGGVGDDKVYNVKLSKPAMYAGRMLSPGKDYVMAGYVVNDVADSVLTIEEIGDLPPLDVSE